MLALRAAFVALLLSLAAVGCTRTQAKTLPEPPPLEVPPPPPRVVQPMPPADETTAQPPETGNAAQATVRRAPTRPEPARPDTGAKQEPAKRDPAKPDTPPVDQSTPTVQPDVARTGTLEPALPRGQDEVERTIRLQMTKAKNDLDRVPYKRLTADGKSQYDAARRFITQADQALKERNFTYAAKLADKAATLAFLLLGG